MATVAQNDLIQSIREQIGEVDYSKWKRKPERPTTLSNPLKSESHHDNRSGAACSPICRHPWIVPKTAGADDAHKVVKRKRIKEIQVKIDVLKKTLDQLRHRKGELITMNCSLIDELHEKEAATHGRVNGVLLHYERCRDGIANLHGRFAKDKEEAEKEYKQLKKKVDSTLGVLQQEVDSISDQLFQALDDLLHIKNYKDKEYEARIIETMKLQQSIKDSKLDHDEAKAQLVEVIEAERKKLISGDFSSIAVMREEVADDAFENLDPSVKELAKENQQLQRDIEFHKNQLMCLQEEVKDLDARNKRLVYEPCSHIRQALFPHLYKQFTTCSPDDDIELDIPQPINLPV